MLALSARASLRGRTVCNGRNPSAAESLYQRSLHPWQIQRPGLRFTWTPPGGATARFLGRPPPGVLRMAAGKVIDGALHRIEHGWRRCDGYGRSPRNVAPAEPRRSAALDARS